MPSSRSAEVPLLKGATYKSRLAGEVPGQSGQHVTSAPVAFFSLITTSVQFWAVAAVVAPLPWSYGLPAGARAAWTYLALSLIVGLAALGRLGRVRWAPWWILASMLTLISCVSSSGYALRPGEHWQNGLSMALFFGVLPFVCSSLAAASATRSGAITGFLAAQSLSSIVGILQVATGGTFFNAGLYQGRATGLAGHPNILGILSAIAALAFLFPTRGKYRIGAMVLALTNFTAVLVSGSISALSALLAGCIGLAIARRLRLSRILAVVLVGAVVLVALNYLSVTGTGFKTTSDRVLQTTGQTDDIGTLDARIDIARFALGQIQNDWFYGVGLDGASGATLDGVVTHNLPIRAWYQGGFFLLLGVGVVLGILVLTTLRGVRLASRTPALGCVVAAVTFSLTSASFYQLYFWIVLVFSWVVLTADLCEVDENSGLDHQFGGSAPKVAAHPG